MWTYLPFKTWLQRYFLETNITKAMGIGWLYHIKYSKKNKSSQHRVMLFGRMVSVTIQFCSRNFLLAYTVFYKVRYKVHYRAYQYIAVLAMVKANKIRQILSFLYRLNHNKSRQIFKVIKKLTLKDESIYQVIVNYRMIKMY